MNVYIGSYYKSFGYGAYDQYKAIVVANTESEALGLILEEYPRTTASGWGIIEVDMNIIGVTEICEMGT